jgi:ABC-type nickel/cobalt efflux system permease component RcnA
MLIKPREVRRSTRFHSRLRSQSRRRQEHAASILSTAIVQGALAVSLLLAAVKAYQAVSAQADSIGIMMKLALPLAFTLGGLWCARLCFRNLRSGRETWLSARKRPQLEEVSEPEQDHKTS